MKQVACAFVVACVSFTALPDAARAHVPNCPIDLFIGTEGSGHVTPAATVPFGMVQAGPDTGVGKWAYCAGYQYSDNAILGFSQTHLSGTGCPDLGDVSIMPFTGEFDGTQASRFRKTDEKAGPGWYEVTLARSEIKVEITASERVAHYALTYTNAEARVYVNLPFALHYPQNPGWARCKWLASESHFADDRTLVGSYERMVWNRRKVGFAIRFDHPFRATREIPAVEGKAPSRYLLDFDLESGEPLKVKIALSTSDSAAALRNLEAESAGWDFEAVRAAATSKWNDVFSRFAVEGEPNRVKAFYTALYRLCVQPNDIADAGERPFYSTFSTWDTYRAAHPLYTIFMPERVGDMVDSMLRQGRITGYLPVWTLWGSENQCMIGTHSVPIIVDWFLKEKDVENSTVGLSPTTTTKYWEAAFEQIKETLTKKHEGRIKENWDLIDRYGYYPFDIITGESASRTLECAYDDWCAAKMAEKLGRTDDAAFFAKRAANWRNLIDPETGMVRGRDSAGRWRTPFDPFALGHGGNSGNDFTEGNSWQYTWHVQQDPEGLIAALGGKERFAARLESLFAQEKDEAALSAHHDVSGLIGQYAHGNEPSHHVIYLFQYAGRGDLTAKFVREVFDTQYGTTPDGLCGNDDCGQMSAWYVFSAMGFYPLNPCGGEYVIGAPQVEKATLRVGRSHRWESYNGDSEFHSTTTTSDYNFFTVIARGLSKENKYVKSVTLNGHPLTRPILRHADILAGGELVFEMANR